MKKRFIEEHFPIKEISEISAKEKNIRHGHISTLHIWWARRPLAASRATSYTALISLPEDERKIKEIKEFIIKLAKWENSLNFNIIEKAREDILRENDGRPPRVLDPFAGGGSIPLETLRLGCETYAVEYNPVAVLILKCTLEYPQKYKKIEKNALGTKFLSSPLLKDVEKWGNWVLEEVRKEIERFYPEDKDGFIPIGYIWARTVPCQNPSCGTEIPLMRQFWLAKKKNKKVALYPYIENNEVKFKIVGDGYDPMPEDFDPSKGTIKKATVVCPVCGSVIDPRTLKKLFKEGKNGERLIAVVLRKPKEKGKKYRIATEKDIEIFKEAEEYLKKKREEFIEKWGFDPIPDEPTPEGKGRGAERAFMVRSYNLNTWGDLFNARQKLALITFMDKIRESYQQILDELKNRDDIEDKEEYAKAVVTYLALGLNRLATYLTVLTRWRPDALSFERAFDRQALQMVWDYGEVNPFSGSRGEWDIRPLIKVLKHLFQIPSIEITPIPKVSQGSVMALPYPDNYFDAVFTDPPYYDNVPYSYLSDFFYVWLKRSIGDLYPELFVTPLTPKSEEIVVYSYYDGGFEAGKKRFEGMLKKAFKEIARVLKPNGIAIIVYTHKSTSGWETLINSLLESELVVTASWPIDTEMKKRLRAKKSAALASSIYFVCRKMERKDVGWFDEIKKELRDHLHKRLDMLWKEGISGADFFVAAIGSAVEVFGKYRRIMDYAGNEITAKKLLEYIREIVADYAIRKILHDGIYGELTPLTRFYILWRWAYGEAKVHFDDARKLAQSMGVYLERELNKRFIKKENEFIRVLGPQDRKIEEVKKSEELIDVLHYVLLLWKEGRNEEIKKILAETGYGEKEHFYLVAQAISGTLPMDSRERELLEGFLSEKDRLIYEVKKIKKKKRVKKIENKRLFE